MCGYRSLFYSEPVLRPYEGEKTEFTEDDFDVVIKCEVCGGTVLSGPAIKKLFSPGLYLPLPLDVFQMALKYEEEHSDNE